jgi:hypothetical protein
MLSGAVAESDRFSKAKSQLRAVFGMGDASWLISTGNIAFGDECLEIENIKCRLDLGKFAALPVEKSQSGLVKCFLS